MRPHIPLYKVFSQWKYKYLPVKSCDNYFSTSSILKTALTTSHFHRIDHIKCWSPNLLKYKYRFYSLDDRFSSTSEEIHYRKPRYERQNQKYKNRPRGDLSEYNYTPNSLTFLSGGKKQPVFEAWEAGDFNAVIDYCNDAIEAADSYSSSQTQLSNMESPSEVQRSIVLIYRSLKAAALNQKKLYKEAIDEADIILRITNYKHRDAWCIKGTALNALGNLTRDRKYDEQALECFEKAWTALGKHEIDLELSLNHATLLFKLGMDSDAEEILVSALNADLNKDLYIEESIQSIKDSDPFYDEETLDSGDTPKDDENNDTIFSERESIIKTAEARLKEKHTRFDPDLCLLLASLQFSQNRFSESVQTCNRGLRATKIKGSLKSQTFMEILDLQIKSYANLGQNEQASLVSKLLLKVSPNEFSKLQSTISFMEQAGESPVAIVETIDNWITDNIHNTQGRIQGLYSKLYFVLMSPNFSETYQAVLSQILKLESTSNDDLWKPFYEVGSKLFDKQKYRQCNILLDHLLFSSKIRSQALVNLKASNHLKLGEFENAIKFFSIIIKADPSDATPLIQRATAYLGQNQIDLCENDINAALSLEPSNSPALMLKVKILKTKYGKDTALKYLTEIISKQSPNLLQELGFSNFTPNKIVDEI